MILFKQQPIIISPIRAVKNVGYFNLMQSLMAKPEKIHPIKKH